MPSIQLEVCTNGVSDSVEAEKAGADRVELNAALELGGLTPSVAAIEKTIEALSIPVVVMIRPRAGDFVYSSTEIETMMADIAVAHALHASGVVFGVLNQDGTIHTEVCRALIDVAGVTPCIFHRAFDETPDPSAALEKLIQLGFRRVLTSGQADSVVDGAGLVRSLRDQADGRIEILPGAGVQPGNVKRILTDTGADQIHGSFSVESGSGRYGPYRMLDADAVTKAKNAIEAHEIAPS